MKLVKFKDGSYGIRSNWFFGWRFYDLYYFNCLRKKGDKYFPHCKGTKDQCISIMNDYEKEKRRKKDLIKSCEYEIVKND